MRRQNVPKEKHRDHVFPIRRRLEERNFDEAAKKGIEHAKFPVRWEEREKVFFE